jgi:hypothetical protein
MNRKKKSLQLHFIVVTYGANTNWASDYDSYPVVNIAPTKNIS